MASVRLTNELRDKIRYKLRAAAQKYEETLGLNETDYSTLNQWINENVVQPEAERTQKFIKDLRESVVAPLKSIIESEEKVTKGVQKLVDYMTSTLNNSYGTAVKLTAKLPLEDGQTEEDRKCVVQSLDFNQVPCMKKNIPVLDKEWGGKVRQCTTKLSLDTHFPDMAAKLVEERQFTINQNAHMRQINILLDDCNTVKQLIEAWPEAKALLPDWVHDKMRERTPTQKREKKEISAASDDVRKMTGLAISLSALDS